MLAAPKDRRRRCLLICSVYSGHLLLSFLFEIAIELFLFQYENINSLVSFSALSSVAYAFPSAAGDSLLSADVIAKLAEGLRGVAQESHEKRLLVDPLTTPIDGERYSSVI